MVRLSLCMGAVVAATTVYACSSTPAPGGSGDGGAADVSADAPSDAPSDSGVVVAADAGKGIIVKVNGVQEELRAGAAATTLSTGWGIQASDGKTSNHGLVIILRMLGGNGQVLTGPLVPGTYACNVSAPNAKTAGMQYNAPDTPAFAYQIDTTCQVDLTAFGAGDGGAVIGTFTGKGVGIGADASVDLVGSFDVNRIN